MTMTKTTEMVQVICNLQEGNEFMHVILRDIWDDPDDDDLPISKNRVDEIYRYQTQQDEDGNITQTPTDLSGEDQLIQDIAAVVWA